MKLEEKLIVGWEIDIMEVVKYFQKHHVEFDDFLDGDHDWKLVVRNPHCKTYKMENVNSDAFITSRHCDCPRTDLEELMKVMGGMSPEVIEKGKGYAKQFGMKHEKMQIMGIHNVNFKF